jgi:hypothetical protein
VSSYTHIKQRNVFLLKFLWKSFDPNSNIVFKLCYKTWSSPLRGFFLNQFCKFLMWGFKFESTRYYSSAITIKLEVLAIVTKGNMFRERLKANTICIRQNPIYSLIAQLVAIHNSATYDTCGKMKLWVLRGVSMGHF